VAIEAGQNLLHYRLVEKIGEGGMGVVWKALDTSLDREVAVKVLPEWGQLRGLSPGGLSPEQSPAIDDRLVRFEREAKLLATLNHPNIATVHGLHEDRGVRFLAMELVAGEDLSRRLNRGALPLDESLKVALEIAVALEAAHAQGVVHRDLKPANVVITPENKIKVLDFGLAKAFEPAGAASSDPSFSPTMTSAGTIAGVILGTASYMSPEQARGKTVDKRCDVWAFGCLLFELLTARKVYEGETVTDTISQVLQIEPNWDALPRDLPREIRRLLGRCLQKDPAKRLRDIGDAQIEIGEALEARTEATRPVTVEAVREPSRRRGAPLWVVGAVAGVLVGLLAGFALWRTEAPATAIERPLHLSVTLPEQAPLAGGGFLPPLAFSPDGEMLVYAGVDTTDGVRRLFVRRLDRNEATPLPGTEGAEGPFFSPDGEWVGFHAEWKLKKVAVSGGALPQTICPAADFRGAAWGPDGTIVFTPGQIHPLFRVPDTGGEPEVLTEFDLEKGEWGHRFPQFLPDGDTVIFTAHSDNFNLDTGSVHAVSLSNGKRRHVLEASADVRVSPTGHLVYVQASTMVAVPFDAGRLEVLGPAFPVIEGVAVQVNTGAAQFAISNSGRLAYVPGEPMGDDVRLVLADREGQRTELVGTNTLHRHPRFSPDGKRFIVVAIGKNRGGVWAAELSSMDLQRLTSESNVSVWSQDGSRIFSFNSMEQGNNIFWKTVDGGREEILLTDEPDFLQVVTDIGADGTLAYDRRSNTEGIDSWIVSTSGDVSPEPFLEGPDNDTGVRFSPDQKYAVFVSDRSKRFEVYVTTYPDKERTWQISSDGGSQPVWSADGSELFFRSGEKMMAASIDLDPTFRAGTPRVLFQGSYEGLLGEPGFANFDASPDGQRFLMIYSPELDARREVAHVVLGWSAVLVRGSDRRGSSD